MYPILFEFGPITVFSLWLFVAIGFVVASLLFVRMAQRNRLKLSLFADHSVFLFIITLISSRILFILLHTDLYFYRFQLKNLLDVFAIWDKGLSFWGALAGWFCGIVLIGKKRHESLKKMFDHLIPPILIGLFFGNIGAFLDGINYGKPTALPWGMVFRSANVKYISPIHPTQLYSAFYTLLLGIALFILLKNLRGRFPGFVAEIGMFSFSVLKFLEEFFRGDETIKIFSVRFPQIIALAGIAMGGYLLWQRYRTEGVPFFTKPNSGESSTEKSSLQNQTISGVH